MDYSTTVSASTSATSGNIDFTSSYAGTVNVAITNGATAPTAAGNGLQLQVAKDTGTAETWFDFGGPLRGGVDNNGVYDWGGIEVPIGVMYMRGAMDNNAANQSVTVKIMTTKVTAMA
jgi:hypothetical protein